MVSVSKTAQAGIFAVAAAAAIGSAVVIGDKLTEAQQCVTQPSDGGVCYGEEPDHSAKARFAPGVPIPLERSSGQCTEPEACPGPGKFIGGRR